MSGGGSSDSSPGSSDSNPAAADCSVVLSELLGHIHGYYKAALDRLPVEVMPALIPRLLDAGVGFGLLDPVSNIIANTVSCEPLPESSAALGKEEEEVKMRGRKRKRNKKAAADAAMSEIITDASSISCLPPILETGRAREPSRSARSMASSRSSSATSAISPSRRPCTTSAWPRLTCSSPPSSSSAVEARQRLVRNLLPNHRDSPQPAPQITRGTFRAASEADSQKPVQLATLRLHRYIKNNKGANNSLNKLPLGFTESLRSLFLEKIHGLYLKAIAQLPRDALRRRHHRGLLKAGLCFGPADDPVSNVILNTIWRDKL